MLGDRHDADALAVHERAAPVADLAGFVGDVDDGLLDAEVRAFDSEFEFSDDLEAGRFVFAAGEFCRARTGYLAFVWASPEEVVPRQHAFRADVESPGARAAFALAVGLAQVQRVHAVDLVGEHSPTGRCEHDACGFVFQLDAVFVPERLQRFGSLGCLRWVACQAKHQCRSENAPDCC